MMANERAQTPEDLLAEFVVGAQLADVPSAVRGVVQQIIRTVCGTAIAGSTQDGVPELRDLLVQQGGRSQARSLVYGDPLPAPSAALLNATMARALDYCDTMVPGLHLGSSVVVAALTAAELRGGCTGAEFLAGVIVGLEAGAHLNLTEEQYGGFDPTGVAGLFGATAAAARIVGLTRLQTRDALALSFNRCSGSFQANADASLAVRFIQGFTASNAIQSVQLAQIGITGPRNFLTGRFGYARLFGRGELTGESIVAGLGDRWEILGTFFKKFPCCGLAQGPTESVLAMMSEHGLSAETVDRIDIFLPAFAHALIGRPFEAGANPRVNAQFSAQYCVANALVRGSSKLAHFEPENVFKLEGNPILERIAVHHDPAITGHSASRFVVSSTDGVQRTRALDIGPGYPGNALTPEEHAHGFDDCLGYASYSLNREQFEALIDMIDNIEHVEDARDLVTHMVSTEAPQA